MKKQFMMLALILLSGVAELSAHSHRDFNKKSGNSHSADYVIVGGGTTGCVLARRLSEKHTVILLESGIFEDDNSLISNPLNSGSLVLDHTNEFFAPLGHADVNQSPNNKRFPGVAGLLAGGGSSVNGMQYVRGTRGFYTAWEEVSNDSDWGPDNAFSVFKEIETFNGIPGEYDPEFHGEDGPIDVRQAVSNNVLASNLFVDALVDLGYPRIDDYNDPNNPTGAFVYWQLNQKPNKLRESSSTAYLQGYLKRKSCNFYVSKNRKLSVYTKAHADKILFCQKRKCRPVAEGVRAVVDGKETVFYAKRKVILCAGALQNPILLQVSGIGEKSDLDDLCVPVVYNNPNVGQHFLNHPILALSGKGFVPGSTNGDPEGLYSGGAFLDDPTTPQMDRGFELIGIASPNAEIPEEGIFTIATLELSALSKGYIKAINSDFFRMPEYDFQYLVNEHDIESFIEAYQIMYAALVEMDLVPLGPDSDDREAVKEYVFKNYSQAYHYTGSCLMARDYRDGVVDSSGHVFGVKNLVVADNSIIPVNPLGNTVATAFLIGNIIADKLLSSKN